MNFHSNLGYPQTPKDIAVLIMFQGSVLNLLSILPTTSVTEKKDFNTLLHYYMERNLS